MNNKQQLIDEVNKYFTTTLTNILEHLHARLLLDIKLISDETYQWNEIHARHDIFIGGLVKRMYETKRRTINIINNATDEVVDNEYNKGMINLLEHYNLTRFHDVLID